MTIEIITINSNFRDKKMKIEIDIKEIVVINRRYGTDSVMIILNTPGATSLRKEEGLLLKFEASPGTGIEYVKKTFGKLPIRWVSEKTGENKIIN